MRNKLLYLERVLLATGLVLLAIVAAAFGHRYVASQSAIEEFERLQAAPPKARAEVVPVAGGEEAVDFSLWSQKRIRAYRDSLLVKKDRPLGVFSVSRIGVRAPVFEGTDDLVLNRGVGWIAGTARPGDSGDGNIGIAGHRDGFFRAFKDVAVGDVMELETLGAVSYYSVDSVEIVRPEDVHVLAPRGVASITLVTCYPFYFVGDAPQRFIVHGKLQRRESR